MKNIFKSSKNKKSMIGAMLAAISLFSFNFTPISIISQKIASAAVYKATETKVTENSSNQIANNDIVSNLKEFFSDSNSSLNINEYYQKQYETLILEKIDNYLRDNISDYTTYLNTNGDLAEYYSKVLNKDYLEFIYDFISTLPKYSSTTNKADRLSIFYNDIDKSLTGTTHTYTTAEQDGVTSAVDVFSNSSVFYKESLSYKSVKEHIDNIIKQTISIVSYDGTTDNKVAAIIAKDAPTQTDYKYGSVYQKISTPHLEFNTGAVNFDSNAPFYFQKVNSEYKQLKTFPYQINTNGTLVVYTLETESTSLNSTYDYLGYKTISLTEAQNKDKYFAVPYSIENSAYFSYLYKELQTNNKVNENITFEKFKNLFYKEVQGITQSTLFVKYTDTSYLYDIYVTSEDFAKLSDSSHAFSDYIYKDYVKVIDSAKEDYVTITSTTLSSTYKATSVGDVTLYFKNEIIPYTKETIIYLTDNSGDYIFEDKLVLDIEFEQVSGKDKIYVLDESENANENEIYQSLGYTVIDAPTIDYLAIEKTDKNYNELFKLYYKYANTDNVFAKNLLVTDGSNNAKNAVYVLSTSVESGLTELCKINNFIPLTTDELKSGFFTKVNAGDPLFSDEYELYYKYDTSMNDDGTFVNAKKENVIYEYTSATSEYKGFYKTDSNYNIEDYVKIQKSDENYKQGYDLYYKKTTKKESNPISQNTIYYFQSKNTITFSANSYYAISFYVNTTGENITASLEIVDDNKILNNAKVTGISTNGKWIKYYLYIATDLLSDSKAKITMSMGTKDGISENNTTLSGSVLFDDVVVYKINETDYYKNTINNEVPYVLTEGQDKIDSTKNNNSVIITTPFSARQQNEAVISGFNNIFDFDTIDSSYLSNSQENGGILQNIDIDKLNGYNDVSSLWQYYISRQVSGKANNELLEAYRQAYKDKVVNISIELEKDAKPEIIPDESQPETTADNDEDDKEKVEINPIISDTFKNNNKILKIANSSASMSLGVISTPFTLKSSECYKISLWIYSNQEKATATVKLLSYQLTAQNNDYGVEVSVGSSDISAYLEENDDKTNNEYRWLPVELYVQGDILSDRKCNLVLLADENSTIYFDNIKIERITTDKYTNTSSGTRVYKTALTNSSTAITKLITNGFFNDSKVTDLKADSLMPREAQNWTITTDAAQDYVTAGIISSKNQEFIDTYNNGVSINNIQATNMYAVNIEANEDILTSNHKIYTAKTFSLSANSVYKITFEYYYSENNFAGDIISNLYYSAFKPENKISSIRTTFANENANKWNQITFYVETGTNSVSSMLELGVEEAAGTIFFRNVYATTISKTINEIKFENSTNNSGNLVVDKDNISFVDFNKINFTMNDKVDDDGLISSKEFDTTSKVTKTATTGKNSVIVSSYFTSTEKLEKTVVIDNTTYYVYNNNGTNELYKYPVYANTSLENNEKVEDINQKEIKFENGKLIVGTGVNKKEYDIIESKKYEFSHNFNDNITIGSTQISANELNNNYSGNVLILANSNDTDYSSIESKYKISLASSSYYTLKFYIKTSDFEDENFGLSINIEAKDLNINWNNDLINTTKVDSDLHKDSNGFVCYQILFATNTASYSDVVIKFNLGTESNQEKGYAIIAGVELSKLASEDEFNHYSDIFANEEDDSIIKTYEGSKKENVHNHNHESSSEVTWATFFYIFSSLLLFIVLVIAIIAVFIKKHPIKHKVKGNDTENFDVQASTKAKDKINKDKETKSEGGIE